MAIRYICDACGVEIAKGVGVLYDYEYVGTNHGEMRGFGFYAWNDSAARHRDYGHIHLASHCIEKMSARCISELGWLKKKARRP
jgi:hypothetical protein